MKLAKLVRATMATRKYVETRPITDIGFGTFAGMMAVKSAYIAKQLQQKAIGTSVMASLNATELQERLKLLTKIQDRDKIIAIGLGSVTFQDGGGKTYDSEADSYRYYWKEKLNKAIDPLMQLVNTYGIKVQRNFLGSGYHSKIQAEFMMKIKFLHLPYKLNFIGYPTDEHSEENFPELLAYLAKQQEFRNIVLNNPTGKKEIDSVYAILAGAITNRTSSSIDNIDLADMFRDLKQNNCWILSAFVSADRRFADKLDIFGMWKRPQADRQDAVLQRIFLEIKPKKDDIYIIVGDFSHETIQNLISFVNQKFHFKPRIRQMLCRVLPEGMNAIVGVLSAYNRKQVATPHFDELEYLVESDP